MNDFVHLHVHTEYSLLDGASRIKPLIATCKELGMKALAITDHGVMYGVIDFYEECIRSGIKPILGCEVYVAKRSRFDKSFTSDKESSHLILLAKNNTGYNNLVKIVSSAFVDGFYYKPRADYELLEKYSEGLICCSACLAGEIPKAILRDDHQEAKRIALKLDGIFGRGNFFLEIQSNSLTEQMEVNRGLINISNETGIPLVATNDVHYVRKSDALAQDILMCIQMQVKYKEENRMRFSSDDYYLRSPEEMSELFASCPQALENTVKIAEMCNVELSFGRTVLPDFSIPAGYTSEEYLSKLAYDGAHMRYGDELNEEVTIRLAYELDIINKMGYADYYLIVWDFIKFAKDNGITVGPGRGSGAGSLVAYCLKITNVDSLKYNLPFERFLNPERISMPDFDVDFCDERRKEVIDYVIEKYGADHVAQIVTFGTMAAKGSIRDVARVLDIPYQEADQMAKLIPATPGATINFALENNPEFKSKYESNPTIKNWIDISIMLEGMPRNVSTHAAGVVLTKKPVTDYVPVHRNGESIATQFPMATLEKLGLLKVDFLGLRTLTVIQDSLLMIEKNHGISVDFDNMVMNDPEVFKTICDGKTSGIFQLESPGMTRFMMDLQPDNLEDIIAGIALYRPGPMDQIPKYISNKKNPSQIVYQHPILENILNVTYGCMVYQEQVMQIVRDLSGYTMGQSDLVRRAMAKKKHDVMEKERVNFIKGAEKNGVPTEVAANIFEQMTDFASYAFNKAHAACYAVVGYETAWLKTYYPKEFMAAMMNSFMGTAERIAQYMVECKIMGITIMPPDINMGYAHFTVKDQNILFGLAALKNVGVAVINEIVAEREKNGLFKGFIDFCDRVAGTTVNKRCIENLIKAGAFSSFGLNRAQLLNTFEEILEGSVSRKKRTPAGQISLFDLYQEEDCSSEDCAFSFPDIKEIPLDQILNYEKEVMGIYFSGHPLDKYTEKINRLSNIKTIDINNEENYNSNIINDGMNVDICGIFSSVKKKNTKNNTIMAYGVFEDLYGSVEVLIFPKVLEKFNHMIQNDTPVLMKGRLSVREDESPKIIMDDLKLLEVFVNTNSEILTYYVKSKDLYYVDNFIRYFSGRTKIRIYNAESRQLEIEGYINPAEDILMELNELTQ